MKELKIEQWPVERLRPYGRELKITDKALPQMADALRQWGFRIPLLVTGDGEIIDGKTRYRAALELRMETVPVIVADDMTPIRCGRFGCWSTAAQRGRIGTTKPCARKWPNFGWNWMIYG